MLRPGASEGKSQVSRSRQANSRSSARRGTSGLQQNLIYLIAGVVLAAAALIVLAGVYITQYRPPRVRILTVQNEHFNASQVVDRGAYLTAFQGGVTSAATLATDTLSRLEDEASLRIAGPALVGDVTQDQVDQQIAKELGLAPIAGVPTETPTPAGGAAAGATGTATATATATPEPTATAAAGATGTPTAAATPTDRATFATKYQDFLNLVGLSKHEFEQIVRAQIIQQRLQQQFQDSLGSSGPQVRLSRIRLNDSALAQVIEQQLKDGGDFAQLHDKYSTGKESGAGGDIGWSPVSVLPADVQSAVKDLKTGEVSGVVKQGTNYDVYEVTDRATDRAYDDTMKQQLVSQQVQDWLNVEQAKLTISRSMSASEESWLNDHILAKAQALATAAQNSSP